MAFAGIQEMSVCASVVSEMREEYVIMAMPCDGLLLNVCILF